MGTFKSRRAHEAQCAFKKALGDNATARMIAQGGESLGAVLVAQGLAEEWKGYRSG